MTMRWKDARIKLREMLSEFGADWSPEYREAVKIAMERIEQVEDLQDEDDMEDV